MTVLSQKLGRFGRFRCPDCPKNQDTLNLPTTQPFEAHAINIGRGLSAQVGPMPAPDPHAIELGDGWRAGHLTDDEILARLFRLNQERAAK